MEEWSSGHVLLTRVDSQSSGPVFNNNLGFWNGVSTRGSRGRETKGTKGGRERGGQKSEKILRIHWTNFSY